MCIKTTLVAIILCTSLIWNHFSFIFWICCIFLKVTHQLISLFSLASHSPWPNSLWMTPGQYCTQSPFQFCDPMWPPSWLFLRMVPWKFDGLVLWVNLMFLNLPLKFFKAVFLRLLQYHFNRQRRHEQNSKKGKFRSSFQCQERVRIAQSWWVVQRKVLSFVCVCVCHLRASWEERDRDSRLRSNQVPRGSRHDFSPRVDLDRNCATVPQDSGRHWPPRCAWSHSQPSQRACAAPLTSRCQGERSTREQDRSCEKTTLLSLLWWWTWVGTGEWLRLFFFFSFLTWQLFGLSL